MSVYDDYDDKVLHQYTEYIWNMCSRYVTSVTCINCNLGYRVTQTMAAKFGTKGLLTLLCYIAHNRRPIVNIWVVWFTSHKFLKMMLGTKVCLVFSPVTSGLVLRNKIDLICKNFKGRICKDFLKKPLPAFRERGEVKGCPVYPIRSGSPN